MSADLSQVRPGWRGTDPDGGAWVLTRVASHDSHPWIEVATDGKVRWHTQEEAEAAGLVRLIPAVGYHYDERGEDVVPDDEVQARLERNPQAVEAIQQAEKDLRDGKAVGQ